MPLTAKSVPFDLLNTPIDYFALKKEHFSSKEFDVKVHDVHFDGPNDYLDKDSHLKTFKLEEEETVVLNFQVGKGKTSIIRELVLDYLVQGYYVLICTPFLKLVKKERQQIIDLFPKKQSKLLSALAKEPVFIETGKEFVFHTDDYSREDLGGWWIESEMAAYKKSVHLMTINLLLGNSGSKHVEQTLSKRNYIKHLLRATKDSKVLLIFDELHESVHNFESHLIPNLLKWRSRVSKVIIASATYSAATIPAIKAISCLTNKRLKIFQSERTKTETQAKIHLHLLTKTYNSHSRAVQSLVKRIITHYKEVQKPVNILTGHKGMAIKLADACFTEVITDKGKIKENYLSETVYLSTSKNKLPFISNGNNVGTTFKTGVDVIDNPLVIVFPSITNDPKSMHYGIFTDGIPSIVQAVGRLRTTGEIHLIILKPGELIGKPEDYSDTMAACEKWYIHRQLSQSYEICVSHYNKKLQTISGHVGFMETGLLQPTIPIPQNYKRSFGFWFPNIHEYLLSSGSAITVGHKNPSYGRTLSPYIIWACINNQFANATLEKIKLYESYQVISLDDSNSYKKFLSILKTHHSRLKTTAFRDAVKLLKLFIGYKLNSNEETEEVRYSVRGATPCSAALLINKEPGFTRSAIRALYKVCTGEDYLFESKEEYLNLCICEAKMKEANEKSALTKLYSELNILLDRFRTIINPKLIFKNEKQYISNSFYTALDDALVTQVRAAIINLRKEDEIISSKVISLLQGIEGWSIEKSRKPIFQQLKDLCFKAEPTYVQIKGERYNECTPLKGLKKHINLLS